MAVAREFSYLRYNPDVVGDVGPLLCPPYDVVDDDERRALAAVSPWQAIHVELPEGGDATRSRDLLAEWIDTGALEAGDVGIAVVQQRYEGPDGVRRTRTVVSCEVAIPETDAAPSDRILEHERTFDAPKQQRLELMKQAGANISPVFLMYHDRDRPLADLMSSVTDDEPDVTGTAGDGSQFAIWFVTDVAVCEQFRAAVAPHPLLIADGHHRYGAAARLRDQQRAESPRLSLVGGTDTALPPHTGSSGVNGVMAMIANSADEGICVFPTHRIVNGTSVAALHTFALDSGVLERRDASSVDEAVELLNASTVPGFVTVEQGAAALWTVPEPGDLELAMPEMSDAYRSLDVTVLHAMVLDGGAMLASAGGTIRYTRDLPVAVAAANAPGTVSFLLREVDVARVHAVAEAGEVMPQKSTYFFPKLPTGVTFRLLGPLA